LARLEDLTRGAVVKGVLPKASVSVVDLKWHGSAVAELTYKDESGHLGHELLYRDREPELEVLSKEPSWSFDGDGDLFRIVSEAYRIQLAYLFDPLLAVHTSLVEPLPHQITAVYRDMLPRQPLKFLLADDPGAGKTIMAGLLIKELAIRGDLRRCMVVCPGMLAEQWQDELWSKLHLPFEILTNENLEAARTGNWFKETPLVICRLDKLSRNDDVQDKLDQTEWDLIIVDEAHKMSAHFFSGEFKPTKRYLLGKRLAKLTRHFLLMTATPHNGKEEDFQLFLQLLDEDRFEGRFRDGVHKVDVSDIMRRMVKENLVKFDGKPLFPERVAYTVDYTLSEQEARLYREVTDYVTKEFNRADALQNEGRKGTVGFALTVLQRRLASSPEAILQSIRRRRARLETRVKKEQSEKDAAEAPIDSNAEMPILSQDDLDDLEEAPDGEVEAIEEQVVDLATAAQTIVELEAEIATLKRLEQLAEIVRRSGTDRKWEELSSLLQTDSHMSDPEGNRLKLVIFSEHRDTLNYLAERIRALLGKPEAVVTIHGGIHRDDRRETMERFNQDKDVQILVATDAAGEGINLQRAHLMVNYDLPWNPNRIEQRFGRIHRIGQTEVCHLWNLVADGTREGDVFKTLFLKLEEQRESFGGSVFDILGKIFQNVRLRDLLISAIRYGEKPEVKARLQQTLDSLLNKEQCIALLEERALAHDTLDAATLTGLREEMDRAEARRLQPYFIQSLFLEAFQRLGGMAREREAKRFELTHVPAVVRNRGSGLGVREDVLDKYERVTFEKELINVAGKPLAEFICPGHPLLDRTIDVLMDRHRELLKRGTVLVDDTDPGTSPHVLVYLEHAIQDALTDRTGGRRVVSRQLQFVELDPANEPRVAGYAPYLDYRPATDEERALLEGLPDEAWLKEDLEAKATSYAVAELVPRHFDEVRRRKEEQISKTMSAVKERLTKEITYWDHRAEELKAQELAGKTPRLNSGKARQRADDLQGRLQRRMEELEQERHLSPLPPNVRGAALVVPTGLLAKLQGKGPAQTDLFARETERIEKLAMDAVFAMESALGFKPVDVSGDNPGYDIESRVPGTAGLRFIEVKGRVQGATKVIVTRNEILTSLNKPESYILALVSVEGEKTQIRYVRRPFDREPGFAEVGVIYDFVKLWNRGEEPSSGETLANHA
jgi:superfamily II DNA or RNA helicase